jgi:hypothetical protein
MFVGHFLSGHRQFILNSSPSVCIERNVEPEREGCRIKEDNAKTCQVCEKISRPYRRWGNGAGDLYEGDAPSIKVVLAVARMPYTTYHIICET